MADQEEPKSEAETAADQAEEALADAKIRADSVGFTLAAENVDAALAGRVNASAAALISDLQTHATAARTAATAYDTAAKADDKDAAITAKEEADKTKGLIDKQLERAQRLPAVATLDNAAKVLVAAFTTISAALVGAGFASGDFTRFYRNNFGGALAFLILAGISILIGTFAFLIDALQSQAKLRLEQTAIYAGVVTFAAAFIIAAWGLASNASGGNEQPTLTTALTTSPATQTQPAQTELTAHANRASVPSSDQLILVVWGHKADESGFDPLRYQVVGPGQDGAAGNAVDVTVPATLYDEFTVVAYVGAGPPPQPSLDCTIYLHSACAVLKS